MYNTYSIAWVNKFEIKDRCIEFMINNVSPKDNAKIKLSLKVGKICRDGSSYFLWNK